MPAGIGYPPPMGGGNPANMEAMAEAGDPRAMAMIQALRQQAMQGGAGGPGGGVPPTGPAGGAPAISPAAPAGALPSMSQAEFSGYGRPNTPDAQAAKAQQQIQLLRLLAKQQGMTQ